MKRLAGLVYIKHGRVGSRSEGPDYFLQTKDGDFLLRWGDRPLWEPDYRLEFYGRRMVEVHGEVRDREVQVERIDPILATMLP
ncbi:MAG: hypothetical protein KDK70_19435 [Myxococcales bacterium]|nr:hypothetical protein [Myxococcales bacterium]